jgi:hypothetical protein
MGHCDGCTLGCRALIAVMVAGHVGVLQMLQYNIFGAPKFRARFV